MLNIGVDLRFHACPCACLGPCDDAGAAPPGDGWMAGSEEHRIGDESLLAGDDQGI